MGIPTARIQGSKWLPGHDKAAADRALCSRRGMEVVMAAMTFIASGRWQVCQRPLFCMADIQERTSIVSKGPCAAN